MSGHSKWSTIKREKAVTDKTRGLIFTRLANAISIAVREGGEITDPEKNVRLRVAIDKAKAANMPKDNITRAINRGAGKGVDNQQLEKVVYEIFAPFGVGIIVVGVTDNKQRTASFIKNILRMHGGSLGNQGSMAYLFERLVISLEIVYKPKSFIQVAEQKKYDTVIQLIESLKSLDDVQSVYSNLRQLE